MRSVSRFYRMERLLPVLLMMMMIVPAVSGADLTVAPEGADFVKIQDAINAASPGDTITVSSGVYAETVTINKTVALFGTDTGGGSPVIDGGGQVVLAADSVTFDGFRIANTTVGISGTTHSSVICNNTLIGNSIEISASSDTLICSNSLTGYSWGGIALLATSPGNTIRNNQIADKGGSGIFLSNSHFTVIEYNNITNNGRAGGDHSGIGNDWSNNYVVAHNMIRGDNYCGIRNYGNPQNGTIINNTITDNGAGICGGSSSRVYLNNFINDDASIDAVFNSTEPLLYSYLGEMHSGFLGNYWSDYTGTDANGDGIGDTPRGSDYAPLMDPWEGSLYAKPDLSITELEVPLQVSSLDSLEVRWMVYNLVSEVHELSWQDTVYLSVDPFLSEEDTVLATEEHNPGLWAGEGYTGELILTSPPVVANGTYYILVKTDADGAIPETREWNNAMSTPITIGSEYEFSEETSSNTNLAADIAVQEGCTMSGTISGDLSGTFSSPSLSVVRVSSGAFAGQGLLDGTVTATLDGIPYAGKLEGVVVPDPAEKRILLKGTVTGSEMSGLVDGYLEESVPDSGNFDLVNTIWRLNRFAGQNQSVDLDAAGSFGPTGPVTYPATALAVMQTTLSGSVSGDYNEPVTLVITHVAIADGANPYNGRGFASLSSVSATGSGDGWLTTREIASGIHVLRGMFSKPLAGVAAGSITASSPRSFSMRVERTDLGLPPLPDLSVSISGPNRLSPGQTVDYVIEVRNTGLTSASNVIVADALPQEFRYVSSSMGGVYRWENHEVFWVFDTLPPSSSRTVYVRGTIAWGLPAGLQLNHKVHAETTGLERDTYPNKSTALCDLNKYINYQPGISVGFSQISASENSDIRQSGNFQDILSYAGELGYIDTNTSSRMTRPDGSQVTLSLVMSSDPANKPAIAFITRYSDGTNVTDWFLYQFTNNSISLFDREGGIAFSAAGGNISYLGNWGEMHSCPRGACRANCYWNELSKAIIGCFDFKEGSFLDLFSKGLGSVWASEDCINCKNLPPGLDRKDACARCTFDVIGAFPATKGFACMSSLVFETTRCEIICRNAEMSNQYNCNPGDTRTRCTGWWNIKEIWNGEAFIGEPSVLGEVCQADCTWKWSSTRFCNIDDEDSCDCVTTEGGGSDCDCDNPNGGGTNGTITPARDPNIKYGPEGHVNAGQFLNYQIEYENEGEGIAYGVYVTDTLDEVLDETTLVIGEVKSTVNDSVIAPAGMYDPATRAITWNVGEVGPSEGGYANISVKVPDDTPDDTEIINYGIVYFPSVPEKTQTNSIISIVGINNPPGVPSNPSPSDGSDNAPVAPLLVWTGSDPDGDVLRYDVYFGNATPPPLVSRDSFETYLNPGPLIQSTPYYWMVAAKDTDGERTEGPIWSFRSSPAQDNTTTNLSYGTTVCGSIDLPSETDQYSFTASGGDTIYAKLTTNWTNHGQIRLRFSNGTEIAVATAGTNYKWVDITRIMPWQEIQPYSILVQDAEGDSTGNYCLYLQRTNKPGNPVPITFGTTVLDAITKPAQMNNYTFSANASDTVYAKLKTNWTNHGQMRLYMPNGTALVVASAGTNYDYVDFTKKLPLTGNYTLLAGDLQGDTGGPIAVYLQRTNRPGRAVNIPFGATRIDTISKPAQMNNYTFSANASDIVYAKLKTNWTNHGQLRLYMPNGTGLSVATAGTNYNYVDLTAKLPLTGTYTLLAGDLQGDTGGPIAVYLQRTNRPGNAVYLNYGTTRSDSVSKPGQMNNYSFQGTAGYTIYTRLKTNWTNHGQMRLYLPNGTGLAVATAGTNYDFIELSRVLPMTGNYTLLAGDQEGDNGGRIWLTIR